MGDPSRPAARGSSERAADPADADAAPPGRPARLDLDAALGTAPPDRLSLAVLAYLALPAAIFLLGWATPPVALAALAAGLAALALAPGWRTDAPPGTARAALLVAAPLGLLWAGASGMHHLLFSAADWQIRGAVLRDLTLLPPPVAYADEAGAIRLLRAPLGYFLPASLVGGGLGGPGAARAALWAWTGLGLALALLLLRDLARRGGASPLVVGLVFAAFGGLDVLPVFHRTIASPDLVETWVRGGGEWWARTFQYSGHPTLLLWVPNHALPGWLVALLAMRHVGLPVARSGDGGGPSAYARLVVPAVAAAVAWSPVAAAGAALVAAGPVLLARGALLATLRDPRVLASAALGAAALLPTALYVLAGSGGIPHGPLYDRLPPAEATRRWATLYAVEVLPWALPVLALARGRLLLAPALAVLALLPLYIFGPGNEATMRGGIAALAVLAVAAGVALSRPAPPGLAPRLARPALALVALLGAAGGALESAPLLTRPAWPPADGCSLPDAARDSVFARSTDWSHYLAPWPDPTLTPWMRPPPAPLPVRTTGRPPPCFVPLDTRPHAPQPPRNPSDVARARRDLP